MNKNKGDEKFCVRCGMSPKEVKDLGYGGCCYVYGKSYGKHSYITDNEIDDHNWIEEHQVMLEEDSYYLPLKEVEKKLKQVRKEYS